MNAIINAALFLMALVWHIVKPIKNHDYGKKI